MAKSGAQRQREWLDRRRDWAKTLLKPCEHCGEFDQAIMDWHHRDPSTKIAGISKMITSRNDKREVVLAEIEKCICLCANCHRKLHFYGVLGDFSLPDP